MQLFTVAININIFHHLDRGNSQNNEDVTCQQKYFLFKFNQGLANCKDKLFQLVRLEDMIVSMKNIKVVTSGVEMFCILLITFNPSEF